MSYQVVRNIGADGSWATSSTVVRALGSNGVWSSQPEFSQSPAGILVMRSPTGPGGTAGVAAAQDLGFGPLSGGFGAGEVINSPPIAHPTTFTALYAHTDSGVAQTQSVVIKQKRAGAVVGTATLTLTVDTNDFEKTLGGEGISFVEGDIASMVMPNPPDSQLIDLSVTLGSAP